MLSDKIKELMKMKKITSKELADKVDVSTTHISYVLNDKRDPSIELLNKIANVLGVSVNDLFTENKDPILKESSITQEETINKGLIENFLDELVEEGIITDLDNIDDDTVKAIFNAVKAQLEIKLKKNKKRED